MEKYLGRNNDLKIRINNHLKKLTGLDINFYDNFEQKDLVELKTVLADIHNVLTLKLAITAANWLCDFFSIDNDQKAIIRKTIDDAKPNTKGFDIQINTYYKIIAEVKCISPVNNGSKFGAAQSDSILDDFTKLKYGKKTLPDTSNYFKFLFLMDLEDRTDIAIGQLIKPSKGTSPISLKVQRHNIKTYVTLINSIHTPTNLDIEKIYVKIIKMD